MFVTERGGPFSTSAFQRTVARAGEAAKLGFAAHPHMLRHACGYALTNRGLDTRALQAYLGHKSITHTVRYAELAPGRHLRSSRLAAVVCAAKAPPLARHGGYRGECGQYDGG